VQLNSSSSIMSLKFAVFMVLVVSALAADERSTRCSNHIRNQKANPRLAMDNLACSARFGKFDVHIDLVHGLINEHISQSFLYSIMSSHFAADEVNRLGLSKFMGGLSDNMWNDAIELIKYVGTRGASVGPVTNPAKSSLTGLRVSNPMPNIEALSEVEAFAWALDNHHVIANQVHDLHYKSRDAALIGFLEKEFTAKHAESIRELSGALTNLVPLVQESAGRDMALYLFDQTFLG